jgi:hypothetical protein
MSDPTVPTTDIIEPAQEFWGSPLRPAGCPICEQAFLIPNSRSGMPCPTCGRGNLIDQPALLTQQPPELMAPFSIDSQALLPIIQYFAQPVRFRTGDFTPENLLQRCVPIYLPMWMVDSTVTAGWTAEVGFDYQVKTTQEAYQNSSWITHEKLEARIRYEPRAGRIHRRYHNIISPAASDHDHLIQRLGRFDLKKAIAFIPDDIQQAILRVPDIPPGNAWPVALEKLERRAASDCSQAAGGQHVRNYRMQAQYTDLNWTQLLLPFYSACYTADDGQRYTVLINGQTGAISGARLASLRQGWQWTGILAGIAAVLILLGLLSFAAASLLPPLSIVGGFLVFLALLAAVTAPVPAIWVWQWNRKQPLS